MWTGLLYANVRPCVPLFLVEIAIYCTSWRQWPVWVHMSHSRFYCSQTLQLHVYMRSKTVIQPNRYTSHIHNAHISTNGMLGGPYTHWLLQRDRGGTGYGRGGYYIKRGRRWRSFLGGHGGPTGISRFGPSTSRWVILVQVLELVGSTQSKDRGGEWVSS